MNSLLVERWYPYVFSALGVGVWLALEAPFPMDPKDLLTATIGFAGVLLGFMATAISVLMAMPTDSVMGELKKSGYIVDLVRYLREVMYALLVFSALSCASFFFPLPLSCWVEVSWIFLALLSSALFYRVLNLMMAFLLRR